MRLLLDEFRLCKKDFIDEIGCAEFGHYKWKRFSRDQHYEQLYQIVSDPDDYNERIAVSNFDSFLSALDYFVGGEQNQTNIGSQIYYKCKWIWPLTKSQVNRTYLML